MIQLKDVYKRHWTRYQQTTWPLRGASATFPPGHNVAIIGRADAGRSTLLRMMAGIEPPTRGEVTCERRVSWPIGQEPGLSATMTGRQNARFVCRVQGFEGEALQERLRFVHEFSELGEDFDRRVGTYRRPQRRRLSFSLSVAFEFDVYLLEARALSAVGGFRAKSRNAIKFLAEEADLIFIARNEKIARDYADAAVWLHEGKLYWFDSVREAWKAHLRADGRTEEEDDEEGE
jgi:capsular polysaccharide transport system ATP-binding protein